MGRRSRLTNIGLIVLPVALFFNSNYFDVIFDNHFEAAKAFSKMVLGLKSAIQHGAHSYLVSAVGAPETLIAFDYTVRLWISDRRIHNNNYVIDRELQRYFASKLDKAPYSEEEFYIKDENFLANEVELTYEDRTSGNRSATLAFLSAGILVSPKLSVFSSAFLKCNVSNIDEETYESSLRCLVDNETCNEHSHHLRKIAGISIANSSDIWNFKTQFFPNLDFCERVKQQLQCMSQWNVVLARLFELEEYSKGWIDGAFDHQKIPSKASPEGEQVRSNQRAIKDRTFLCPDGESRTFFWHLRATPGALRIFFFPIEEGDEKRILIGHIGNKPYYP